MLEIKVYSLILFHRKISLVSLDRVRKEIRPLLCTPFSGSGFESYSSLFFVGLHISCDFATLPHVSSVTSTKQFLGRRNGSICFPQLNILQTQLGWVLNPDAGYLLATALPARPWRRPFRPSMIEQIDRSVRVDVTGMLYNT